MATYRCLSCRSLYLSPQNGGTYYHTCPPGRVLEDGGPVVPFENPRDENLIQEPGGGPVRMKALGAGRDMVAEGDAVTGATQEQLNALRDGPAIGPSPLPEEDLNKGRPPAVRGAPQ